MHGIAKQALTFFFILWLGGVAGAQSLVTDRPAEEVRIDQPTDLGAVSQELDALLRAASEDKRFSGAVVGIVSAGGERWMQSYGLADAADGTPVSADTSRFLVASITKTMTALSILQLYDRGQIQSLDDPANVYLKRVQLPSRSGKEITVRHLLTHRSGLRTLGFGYIRHDQLEAPVNAKFVQSHTSGLIRDPGEAVIYSNLDIALLGVLLEDITGDTLQTYMTREIFKPLNMQTAILNYEIAPTTDYAKAYTLEGASLSEIAFVANTPFLAPAGSVMMSGADFQKYAAFWLDGGRSWSSDILSAQVFEEMVTPQARNHPGADAAGLGIFVSDWNGAQILDYSGAFGGYTAYFAVAPETGLASFLAVAGRPQPGSAAPFFAFGEGADAIAAAITGKPAATYAPAAIEQAQELTGFYVSDRRFTRGVGKFIGLLSPMKVSADPNGYLTIGATSGLGLIQSGVAAPAGDGRSAPPQYGLPSESDPYIKMNVDRARPAGLLESPIILIGIFGTGILLSLVGAVGVFSPARGGGLQKLAKWMPLTGLLSVLGIYSALQLFFPPGRGILDELIAAETRRTTLVNIFSWTLLVSSILALSATVSGWSQPRHFFWKCVGLLALIGLTLLSVLVAATGLADPRLV